MKTSEILELDYREPSDKRTIQKVLKQIGPLSKHNGDEVPVRLLERCIQVLSRKYDFVVSIHLDPQSNKDTPIWRCSVIRYGQSVTAGTNVWGTSVYEVLAKANIVMYSVSRRQAK